MQTAVRFYSVNNSFITAVTEFKFYRNVPKALGVIECPKFL